jgi:hypothetical protein
MENGSKPGGSREIIQYVFEYDHRGHRSFDDNQGVVSEH